MRLDRGDRVAWLSVVRAALGRFPDLDDRDRATLVRGIVCRNALNRLILRFQTQLPNLASTLTRLVPVKGPRELYGGVPSNRPIVFALIHMGPVHAAMTRALHLLRGRRVYVFHAGGEHGHAVSRYFKKLGAIPIINERGALATVLSGIAEEPGSAVILCYDYLGNGGSQSVSFLGESVSVATGLARLVDATQAAVITGWWNASCMIPRFEINAAPAFSKGPDAHESRRTFTASMFAVLESRVRESPQAWTEWQSC